MSLSDFANLEGRSMKTPRRDTGNGHLLAEYTWDMQSGTQANVQLWDTVYKTTLAGKEFTSQNPL
jgi:hypothetical protein